ncbi:MAG: hypothetical protein ABW047_14720 [Nitrospiraceae bacterium]
MRTYLFIGRIVIFTSVALICGLPALSAQATDHLPGAGIPEFMGAQPTSDHHAPSTVVVPAQATWVDDIANALGSYFKAHYPTSDFTSYLKKLTQVRDAEDRGDRRTMELEMGAFFTMLTNQNQGISAGAADEVANFARAVMPVQEYGIFFPNGPEQYGTSTPRFGSEQERGR